MTRELRAKAGIAHLGSHVVVHGKDLHRECLTLGFVHYLLFCVCGRTFDERVVRVLEEAWVATGYPDARIWCNRIAGYLGSARVDPGLAMSAAIAASNSVAYGFRALSLAYRVQAELPADETSREQWLARAKSEHRIIYGYGRPQHGHDERIAVGLASLARAGLRAGLRLKGAFWLHAELGREKGIEMNVGAFWAALAIDFGISQREYEQFMLLMFAPGYAAVYAEQRERHPFAFLAGHQSRSVE